MKKFIQERWFEHIFIFGFFPIGIYGIITSVTATVNIIDFGKIIILGILGYIIYLTLVFLIKIHRAKIKPYTEEDLKKLTVHQLIHFSKLTRGYLSEESGNILAHEIAEKV
jgi:hypothetical protein